MTYWLFGSFSVVGEVRQALYPAQLAGLVLCAANGYAAGWVDWGLQKVGCAACMPQCVLHAGSRRAVNPS